MQILQAEEHSFFWGQPANATANTSPVLPAERLPGEGTAASGASNAASAEGLTRTPSPGPPRIARVPTATFHSIVGAATLPELLQELQSALGEERERGSPDFEHADGAVLLPPHVAEAAMTKVAGWVLDPGSRAGTDPEDVRQALELIQCSMCLSGLCGYSLVDVASILWSLASVLGEYGWPPAGGCVSVVQRWLGSSETVAALQTDSSAWRFSELASLLWGYAALLQASSGPAGPRGARGLRCAEWDAGGVERLSSAFSQEVAAGKQQLKEDVAGPGVDALAFRGSELTRAYGTLEPVAAVELADVAWALSVINRRSSATRRLVDAVAHEVYSQLSNRSILPAAFEPADLVKVVRAYADLDLDLCQYGRDGSVPRMLDAVARHVAQRIRYRHVSAVTRPADCAELLRGFADSGHDTVVIPELLQAVALQICREVATHNTAVPRPLDDDVLSSNSSTSHGTTPPQPGGRGTGWHSVAARFRQPYTPLWERRLIRFQQLGAEQRRRLQEEARTQAYWHWSSLLDGAQVVSVFRSYIRMGHYPGVDLTNSLLLAVQPQLSAMSSGDVSELLQLLAAVRHVPGPQMFDLLAAAALRPPNELGCGRDRDREELSPPAARLSPPDLHQITTAGEAANPLERLTSLWALVMMGWRPGQPDLVEQVLDPVLLEESLAVGLQHVGRLMSLLVLLPRCELTIQRFGLAAIKLREALAAPGASAASMARRDSTAGQTYAWSMSWVGGFSRREPTSQKQLKAALFASGAAMALLGAEGWEMAQQVLSGAQFRSVEEELRRALADPNEGVDSSCLAEVLQGMRDIGCNVTPTTLMIPVDDLRVATESAAQLGCGDEEYPATGGDAEETDGQYSLLVFRPLMGYIPCGEAKGAPPAAPPSSCSIQEASEGRGDAGDRGMRIPRSALSDSQEAVRTDAVVVRLHVCPLTECTSNAPDELLLGWSLVRQALYNACAGGAVALVLTEGKLRSLKGRREELKAYLRLAVERTLER